MKIRQITENTVAGSIAPVSMPLGGMKTRTQKPPKSPKVQTMRDKGKKFVNQISEGKVKELYYDLQHMDNGNFKKKYGKTKEEMRASLKEGKGLADKIAGKLKKNVEKSNKEKKDTEAKVKQHQQDQKDKVSEAEISEADLIVVPGMRKSKDKSFIPHKEDRRDHEVEMARSDLLAAAKSAMRMYELLKDRTEDQGLMGWQQSYITLATDYLQSVADNLEYDARTDEMTGGVLAGGMSNFEEDQQRIDPLVTNALKRMEGPSVNDAVKALIVEIGTREFKDRLQHYKFYVNQMVQMYEKQGVAESKAHKCPKCGGEMVSEELMNEKKDACYYKVKSRYKVWPSAYASGALVKCRKKGSKNWGKGKKK